MSKHTPGPWQVFNGYQVAPADGLPGDIALAVCYESDRVGRSLEETEANAKLIAAAPELLESAKLTLKLLGMDDPCFEAKDELGLALQRAVAKAEGSKV